MALLLRLLAFLVVGYGLLCLAVYLAQAKLEKIDASHPACQAVEREAAERVTKLLKNSGSRTVDSFHRELGTLMWNRCGMARNAGGLREALAAIPALRDQYHREVKVVGEGEDVNQSLEKAGRVADFFELAELLCRDALVREESCGGHFREEHQTPDGEARRDDVHFCHVAACCSASWSGVRPCAAASAGSTQGRKSEGASDGNVSSRLARSPLGSMASTGMPSIAASSMSPMHRPVLPLPVMPTQTA